MVISGPNLLSFLPNEKSPARLERALREYHSPQQAVRCYRALDLAMAEVFRQKLKESGEDNGGFSREARGDLLRVRSCNRAAPIRGPVFPCACKGERYSPPGPLHGWGDTSHLALLGFQARRRGIDARIGIPRPAISPGLVRRLRGCGYMVVGVMA